MAVKISGEEKISAPIGEVWDALNNPKVLRKAIPGCESVDMKSDNEMEAVVTLKMGPIKAKFKGDVELVNLKPPHSYTIRGEGKGGVAGFAKGGAEVELIEEGANTTLLKYTANADVGGKIAQLGSRLIESTAKKLSGQFFSNLNKEISKG